MNRRSVLTVDGIINLVIGALLIYFPNPIVEALGIPLATLAFYPNILGAITLGLSLAAFIGRGGGRSGLGLSGAAAINLGIALVVTGWLLLGNLVLPTLGVLSLWVLVIVKTGLGLAQLLTIDDPFAR
jgi:hypothetical protein